MKKDQLDNAQTLKQAQRAEYEKRRNEEEEQRREQQRVAATIKQRLDDAEKQRLVQAEKVRLEEKNVRQGIDNQTIAPNAEPFFSKRYKMFLIAVGVLSAVLVWAIWPKNPPRVEPFVEPRMVQVQGGTFKMGSSGYDDKKLIYKVTVNDFYIGKYEVT